MTPRSPVRVLGDASFLLGLVLLPWIGVGVAHLATGRDLGAGLQPAYLAFAVSAAALLLDPELRPSLLRPWRGIWGLALAAIAVSCVGIWLAPSGAGAEAWARFAKQVVQWLVMAAIALVTAARLARPGLWGRAVSALAVGVVIQAAYGAFQAAHFSGGIPWFAAVERVATSNPAILAGSEELYLGHAFTGIPRIRGTACEPLYLGNWLLLAIPLLLAEAGRRRRLLVPVLLGVALLVATWSRGAWLAGAGAAMAALVMAWRAGARPRRIHLLAAGGGVLLILGAMVVMGGADAIGLLADRLRQSLVREDWSNLTRLYSMQAAWRAFLLSPVAGVGWGQFGFHFHALVDPAGLQAQFDWPVVNNIPLMVLCETGVIGFVTLVFGTLRCAGPAWRALSPSGVDSVSARGRIRVLGAVVAAVGVAIQLQTFSQYNLPHIWVAVGALIAAPTAAREDQP